MDKTYYYIYKITILTGKLKGHYYIGQHETNNLDDGYRGSGKKICDWFSSKKRIEGVDYIKEILCYCDTWEEMQEMETFYIGDKWKDEYLECLNCREGGQSGRISEEIVIKRGKSISKSWNNKTEEEKQKKIDKYKETVKNRTEEEKEKIHLKYSNSAKNRNMTEEEKDIWRDSCRKTQINRYKDVNERQKTGESSKTAWSKKSDEAKKEFANNISKRYKNMSSEQKEEFIKRCRESNLKAYQNEELKKKLAESVKEGFKNMSKEKKEEWRNNVSIGGKRRYDRPGELEKNRLAVKKGWERMSDERRNELREINRQGQIKSWSSNTNRRKRFKEIHENTKYMNNGTIGKWIKIEEIDFYLSQGWNFGYFKNNKESYKKSSETRKGTTKMNNGIINKYIKKNEVDTYLSNGWNIGWIKEKVA